MLTAMLEHLFSATFLKCLLYSLCFGEKYVSSYVGLKQEGGYIVLVNFLRVIIVHILYLLSFTFWELEHFEGFWLLDLLAIQRFFIRAMCRYYHSQGEFSEKHFDTFQGLDLIVGRAKCNQIA